MLTLSLCVTNYEASRHWLSSCVSRCEISKAPWDMCLQLHTYQAYLDSVCSGFSCALGGPWGKNPYKQLVSERPLAMHSARGNYEAYQFRYSVVSDSLRPHELQHARPPCPSPTPRVHPNPCPLSQWCHPPILSSVIPSIFPSIRVFSNESALRIRWPKYWSFTFSICPSKEHPGLIFRMDWLDLLAVQGTLKSLLQHHSSKASIFQCSAFFTVQLSHPYMTTGKTIALTRWTFLDKVMSLLFNMLSRLVITFLPRSKRLLISCLQSSSAVILEPRKIKSSTVSPSICL